VGHAAAKSASCENEQRCGRGFVDRKFQQINQGRYVQEAAADTKEARNEAKRRAQEYAEQQLGFISLGASDCPSRIISDF